MLDKKLCQQKYQTAREERDRRKRELSAKLVESLTDGEISYMDSPAIGYATGQIAYKEGETAAWGRLSHIMHRVDVDEAGKMLLILRLAVQATDDRYSGRGNDVRRSYMDGWNEALTMAYEEMV